MPDLSIEVDDLDSALTHVKEAEVPMEDGPVEEAMGSSTFLCKEESIWEARQYSSIDEYFSTLSIKELAVILPIGHDIIRGQEDQSDGRFNRC